jgi:hypothetical protein
MTNHKNDARDLRTRQCFLWGGMPPTCSQQLPWWVIMIMQGWPEPYICTVYDRMYDDFPAKNTVCTAYIRTNIWVWPTLWICNVSDLGSCPASLVVRGHAREPDSLSLRVRFFKHTNLNLPGCMAEHIAVWQQRLRFRKFCLGWNFKHRLRTVFFKCGWQLQHSERVPAAHAVCGCSRCLFQRRRKWLWCFF